MKFFAHSKSKAGAPDEPMKEHVLPVAKRAARYAAAFSAADEAFIAGILHDLGKYTEIFGKRLRNEASGLDHWTPGFVATLQKYGMRFLAAGLAIQGHHIGLQHFAPSIKEELNKALLSLKHPLTPLSTLTSKNISEMLSHLSADGISLPLPPTSTVFDPKAKTIETMLDVRMLFSCLVDADYIETEAHFEGTAHKPRNYDFRPEGLELNIERALAAFSRHIEFVRSDTMSKATPLVKYVREELMTACLSAAEKPTGLFTLTAPTGAGKTLAMLAFALNHAKRHGLRRVIMVVPYLTIIEQTAGIYRKIFGPVFDPRFVLENHSMAGMRGRLAAGSDNEDEEVRVAGLLAENWDAPVVVTTSVQCLESLFANSPRSCRKLHRMAKSVILFDEVQTLPPKLAVPTLAALSRLSARYGSSIVFSTATQPAFTHLDKQVRDHAVSGWQPEEIVEENQAMFAKLHRTRVKWDIQRETSWDELADTLAGDQCREVLCIVNLKRHAQNLAKSLHKQKGDEVFHLSTSMCPAHRESVLNTVRERLKRNEPVHLIATQCVEAGVDLSFPSVFRAFAPLEAIAQAAGRCNRNGEFGETCEVIVFLPKPEREGEWLYPPGGYKQAAKTTELALDLAMSDGFEIHRPEFLTRYYKMLYDLTKCTELKSEKSNDNKPTLADALERKNFVDTATAYRLIDQDSINVLVPYDLAVFKALREQLEKDGRLTAAWIRDARTHTVSIFRPKRSDAVWNVLDPIPLRPGKKPELSEAGWFVYLGDAVDYDKRMGLTLSSEVWEI